MNVLAVTNTMGYLGEGRRNGVSNFYRSLADVCNKGFRFEDDSVHVDFVTYGEKTETISQEYTKTFVRKVKLPLAISGDLRIDGRLFPTRKLLKKVQNPYDAVICGAADPYLVHTAHHVAQKQQIPLLFFHHTFVSKYMQEIVSFGADRVKLRERLGEPLRNDVVKHLGAFLSGSLARYEDWLFQKADVIFTSMPEAKSEVERKGHKSALLQRGVDSELFSPSRRTRQSAEPVGVYLGRVSPEKNIGLLERIYARSPSPLEVIGDGVALDSLQNISTITCHGALDGELKARVLANADYFVFPSLTDTFGQAVREAMASGLPAIVTDQGGPQYQVTHGETGFIAKSDEEFEMYCHRLHENPELTSQMGQKAHKHVQQFSWENIFTEMLTYVR